MIRLFVYLFILLPSTFCLGRPNVVFIMADDLGYGDLGCYGNERVNTPNIDALAAGGLRFTDFHSAGPMCSPTRAATLTGLYQYRFGPNFDGALSGTDDRDTGLPHKAVTIAEFLKQAGYATGAFGKWHLGYVPPYFPTFQGFEEFIGLGSGDGDFHTHVDRSGNPDWWKDDQLKHEEGYTTELLTRHSIDFIERHKDEPFFLYIPHLAIHFPWQGPDDPPHRQPGHSYHDDKWGVIPNRSNVFPHVKAMIEALDKSVGETIDTLKRLGLLENTLVVFTSDNGGYIRYSGGFENISSNGPLRGQKAQVFEGGHRVPCIVSWPGKVKQGVTDIPAISMDWFPTFAHLAGAADDGLKWDGVDLAPLLFQNGELPGRKFFWRIRGDWAIRNGPWKLNRVSGKLSLYNLEEDIGENANLAGQYPAMVNRLQEDWMTWESDVNQSVKNYQP